MKFRKTCIKCSVNKSFSIGDFVSKTNFRSCKCNWCEFLLHFIHSMHEEIIPGIELLVALFSLPNTTNELFASIGIIMKSVFKPECKGTTLWSHIQWEHLKENFSRIHCLLLEFAMVSNTIRVGCTSAPHLCEWCIVREMLSHVELLCRYFKKHSIKIGLAILYVGSNIWIYHSSSNKSLHC